MVHFPDIGHAVTVGTEEKGRTKDDPGSRSGSGWWVNACGTRFLVVKPDGYAAVLGILKLAFTARNAKLAFNYCP